jgi:hypothetical protein
MANRPVKLKGGRTLDQDLIDKLSSEAEQGYDVSKAQRVFMREGRPVRGKEAGESPRVASRVPQAIYLAAKKRAARDGMTVSEVVRALIAGYAAGQSARLVATLRRVRKVESADSDLTASATYKAERRRTTTNKRLSARIRGERRRTYPNDRGRRGRSL